MRTALMVLVATVASTPCGAGSLPKPEASTALVEPTAQSRIAGKLYTIRRLDRLGPLENVKVFPGSNAAWVKRQGVPVITADTLEVVLSTGKTLSPGDQLIEQWHYAPWCHAEFTAAGRRWSIDFYLGGLGFLSGDQDRRGAFRFEVPNGKHDARRVLLEPVEAPIPNRFDQDALHHGPDGVLRAFLGALAEQNLERAYAYVAPQTKSNGDPIAYQAPVSFETFVNEVERRPAGKFSDFRLGERRGEGERKRIWVHFANGDNDETLLIKIGERWYIEDPLHIIR